MANTADFIIIGGGIAGISAAAALAPHGRVRLLEAEDQLAYHTTGRSAAFYTETYGGPKIQPLTTASKDFLFAEREIPFVHKRGCVHVAWQGQEQALMRKLQEFQALCPSVQEFSADEVSRFAPALQSKTLLGGVYDPDCCDIDVHALMQHYRKEIATHEGVIHASARVLGLMNNAGKWRVKTTQGHFEAPIIINAAGSWGDEVARLAEVKPVGLTPKRRTIITFDSQMDANPAWPLTLDIEERFYFKPESGLILASLADETPSPPCDAQPEELDIAQLIERLEKHTKFKITRVEAKWAGLRNFVKDRLPVYGFAPDAEGFFWCVGQGGWGIQTAPAAAALVADIILSGQEKPEFSPNRFL